MTDKEKMIRRWSDCVREMESIATQVLDYSPVSIWFLGVYYKLTDAAEALEELSKRI